MRGVALHGDASVTLSVHALAIGTLSFYSYFFAYPFHANGVGAQSINTVVVRAYALNAKRVGACAGHPERTGAAAHDRTFRSHGRSSLGNDRVADCVGLGPDGDSSQCTLSGDVLRRQRSNRKH